MAGRGLTNQGEGDGEGQGTAVNAFGATALQPPPFKSLHSDQTCLLPGTSVREGV